MLKNLACAASLGFMLLAAGGAAAGYEQDQFTAARAAYKNSDERSLGLIAERLHAQGYVLAPYLDYWSLLLRLSEADPAEVQAFLTRYASYPFAARLRVEWLKQLGREQAWPQFFAEYAKVDKEETVIACQAALGRYLQGESSALEIARVLWMVGADQPSTCDPLFAAMVDNGVITDAEVWARMRMALSANRITVAKAVSRYLTMPPDAAQLKLFDRAYDNPQRMLEKGQLTTRTRLGRELMIYALERVARNQPALALELWNKARPGFGPEHQAYVWGRLALHAAKRHDPQALELFSRATHDVLDADQLAWKARALLRVRDWDGLIKVIDDMPPQTREDRAWRYWKGRALKEKNNFAAANQILIPLSREHNFYGILAEEELGDVMGMPPPTTRVTEAEVAPVRKLPGIQRALELLRLDLRWEAKSEWLLATRDFDDIQLLAAAELAFREEWYDVAINTADKTSLTHDLALRYPTPYRDLMDGYVRDNQLDEAWVYGLIRQESRFVSYARSGAGASGLMQVMPATASWIAKRIGMRDYHPGLIQRAETNIQLGTYYMRHVLDRMDGQVLLATAAYNAGPGRPKRWADARPMEGAVYAETIPFTETRDYVQKVMSNAHYYAHRLGLRLLTLKQRIGLVAGTGAPDQLAAESTP